MNKISSWRDDVSLIDPNQLYSLSYSAKKLNVSVKTLTQLIDASELRYVWVGKRRKICGDELLRIQKEGTWQSTKNIKSEGQRFTTISSKSMVYDFMGQREKRRKQRQKQKSKE